jgi:hypothetical protein
MREEQGRNVLTVRIENHVTCSPLVRFSCGQNVPDPSFVQARAAYGVQQKRHGIVGRRTELICLFVVARLVVILKFQPVWITAVGVVRENCLKRIGCRSRQLDEFIRSSPTVRWLPNTRCFIPSSRICLRIIAVGPISVHSTIASTP